MRTLFVTIILTVLGFAVHEFGHAAAAKALGYDVIIGTNSVATASGEYEERSHAMIISMAGPLVTLAIGFLGAVLARSTGLLFGFWLAFTSLFIRLMAQVISAIAVPNDEMRVSTELGFGAWTLPIVMVVLLLMIVSWAWRGAKPSIGQIIIGWVGFSIGMTIMVLGESVVPMITW